MPRHLPRACNRFIRNFTAVERHVDLITRIRDADNHR